MTVDLTLLSPGAVTPALTAKLRSLAHDLDRIAIAAAPTAAVLAKAPLLSVSGLLWGGARSKANKDIWRCGCSKLQYDAK
jgi:hypothetical protein